MLFRSLVVTLLPLVSLPGLCGGSRLWSARLLLLETFFSDVSELLTIVTLDSPLIFLLPSLFQEAGPWGEGWRSSSRYLLIGVFAIGRVHPDVFFLWFCLRLPCPGPICRGIHCVWVTGRLVLWFEGVEKFHSPLLFALVFEVDPFRVACQGCLLSFCIVARSIQPQRVLV